MKINQNLLIDCLLLVNIMAIHKKIYDYSE